MNSGILLILSQIIPIIVPPLLAASVAGGAALYQNFVQRLPSSLHTRVSQISNQVVEGVEQSMQGAAGEAKKAAAVTAINTILAGLHLSATAQLVDSAIESAVHNLNLFKDASIPPQQASSAESKK